MAGGRHIENRF